MIRVAIIDANETRRRGVIARVRGAIVADSTEISDAAVVLNPDHANSPWIEQFLRAGKPTLLPLGVGLRKERLQSLADLASNAGARFVVGNPDRYLPSRQLIRQQLDSGKLGEPGLIRLHRWQQAACVSAILCDLDLVLWYFGTAPNRVYAVEGAAMLQVHLGFPNGGMAILAHTSAAFATAGYLDLSVIGSNGAAYADDHQNMQLAYQGGAPHGVCASEGDVHWAALVQEWIHFLSAESTRLESYAASGWHTVFAVKDAIDLSLRTKQAVVPEGGR